MVKLLNVSLVLLVLALLYPAAVQVRTSPESSDPDSTLLQFTSGAHVLGFSQDGVCIAGGDHALKVEFVNSAAVQPIAQATGSSYNTEILLEKVTYNNVWENVDIEYTSAADGIAESTYYLNTPESVAGIRLRYNRPISLDGQGNLIISFENGNMIESAPVVWQEINGQRMSVQANYVIYENNEAGFALAGCRPGVAVTIDPTLTWNTFLGSNDQDFGLKIAVDRAGNIYVTGQSYATWGSPVRAYSFGQDAFVARLNNNGALAWNTFLGGTGNENGSDIALDSSGNVYITGSSDMTWGSPVRAHTGGFNAFVARLNSSGALQWNTFLGGSGWDFGQGIAADAAGNICVTGYSFGTWGSPVRAFSGTPPDAFAAKVDGSGNLIWNTFLGGTGIDFAHGIATDPALNVYIAGYSSITWGSPVRPFTPSGIWYDGFSTKLNGNGVMQWNTFLGGSGSDYCFSIAADANGNSYVAGQSNTTWGSPVRAYSSNYDAFAAKIDGSGNLTWNSFCGGGGEDSGNSVAADNTGHLFIAGSSKATWGNPVRPFTANDDAFAASLSSDGNLLWNSFLGGSGDDVGNGAAVDICGNMYVTGCSDATWGSPVRAFTYGTSGPPEPHPTTDAFAAKITGNPPSITSFTPSCGEIRTVVTITGKNFLCATSVSFGGVPTAQFRVDSNTQITATVGTNVTGKIKVTTTAGTATSKLNFDPCKSGTPYGSWLPGTTSTATPTQAVQQAPVSLPAISVKSASLSTANVAPGSPVTVTADVVNTGTASGNSSIQVYVNGEIDSTQGVTVNSGSSTPVTFTISRNEPGTYSVYVGGASAGSFTVDTFADPNIILYISGALVFCACVLGAIYIIRRKHSS